MGKPTLNDFYNATIAIFSNRGGDGTQQPTAAMGYIKHQVGIYVVKQGGPVNEQVYNVLPQKFQELDWDEPVDVNEIIDSRYLAQTGRKFSEWTGYHAEMVILSAMLSANALSDLSFDNVKRFLSENGGAVICANATACYHCGSFMSALGIEYHGGRGKRSLTGWWNPLSDRRYNNSDHTFRTQDVLL